MTALWDPPPDVALGGVLACLHPARVLDACRKQWGQDNDSEVIWEEIRVMEALYHPGRYVRVAYALISKGSVSHRRLWPEADIVYLSAPVREPMSQRGTIITIDGTEVEAFRFPNDRRLRGLRKFAGRQEATRAWQEWINASDAPGELDPDSLQRLLVRYVPEQKWIVRLRAEVKSSDSATIKKRRIAVRCASPEVCATLVGRHSALARAADETAAPYQVPAIVGANADQGILAVEWNRGESLVETLAQSPDAEVMTGMAAMVNWFHGTTVPGLEVISTSQIASSAKEAAEDLILACPDLSSRIRSVIDTFTDRLEQIDPVKPVTLHNDLHWNQVRIKRGKFTLLDLERMALGDPLIDVANLVTQLRMLGHRPELSIALADARRWANAFLGAWIPDQGGAIDVRRFQCYSVWSLLGLAYGMMRHLRSGWRQLAWSCVESAEETFASSSVEGVDP